MLPFMPMAGHLNEINEYAEMTGGSVLHTSKDDVADRLSVLLDALRQRYTLGYRPSVEKPVGTLCKVSVSLTPHFFAAHPEFKSKDVLVLTRDQYIR
jgi:hypothetical protein